MITYEEKTFTVNVRLDGKIVGIIRKFDEGYAYCPGMSYKRRGDIFPTIAECKKSLEDA